MIGHILAVSAITVSAVLFELGMLAPGDAFFAIGITLLIYTGYQLAARENQPLRVAVVNMFTNPSSYSQRGAFAAFIGTAVVGTTVILQTLAYL